MIKICNDCLVKQLNLDIKLEELCDDCFFAELFFENAHIDFKVFDEIEISTCE